MASRQRWTVIKQHGDIHDTAHGYRNDHAEHKRNFVTNYDASSCCGRAR